MDRKEYTRLAARISIARKNARAKQQEVPDTLKTMGITTADEYEDAKVRVNAVLKPRPVGRPKKVVSNADVQDTNIAAEAATLGGPEFVAEKAAACNETTETTHQKCNDEALHSIAMQVGETELDCAETEHEQAEAKPLDQ